MKQSKNILTDKEMELVSLLMQDCKSTSDIQSKLKRLFAGTIEQSIAGAVLAIKHNILQLYNKTGYIEIVLKHISIYNGLNCNINRQFREIAKSKQIFFKEIPYNSTKSSAPYVKTTNRAAYTLISAAQAH